MPKEVWSYDWSGANSHQKSQDGIAKSWGVPGAPPQVDDYYSRVEVLDELKQIASLAVQGGAFKPKGLSTTSPRTMTAGQYLVGIDFAFGFPRVGKTQSYFWNKPAIQNWSVVHGQAWQSGLSSRGGWEHHVNSTEDFWNQPAKQGKFYLSGRYRQTELVTMTNWYVRPETFFNLVGGTQVGTGSLAGISVLHELVEHCRASNLPIVVWPFFVLHKDGREELLPSDFALIDIPEQCLVVVETYPKLQVSQWLHSLNCAPNIGKWPTKANWTTISQYFVNPLPTATPGSVHQADALIAWYGLAGSKAADGMWLGVERLKHSTDELKNAAPDAVQQEGWIFGV